MATEILRPNAAGDETNLSKGGTSPAPTNWESVDEAVADEDVTRVQTTSAADWIRDLYNIENHSVGSGTINFIKVYGRARSNAPAPDQTSLKLAVKSGGTVGEGDEETMPGSAAWADFSYQWNTNPDTGLAWGSDWSIIDSLQIGEACRRSISGSVSATIFTQVYVEVDYTAGGVDYPISCTANLAASSTVSYLAAWDRGMSPNLTVSTTIARALGYDRGTSPGLTVSATIAKSMGRLITTIANLTVSSTVARFMAYKKTVTSNLTASVTILKGWGRTITTTANLTVSATVALIKGFVRAVTSNLTASSTVDRNVTYTRASTPGLTASSTVDRNVTYTRASTPGLTVSSTVDRIVSYNRATTASIKVTISIIITAITDWITLTLKPRSLAMTLQSRSLALTLKARSLIMTLIGR